MSIKAMNWVFDESQATANDRLVLLAIADQADDEGVARHGDPLTYRELAKKARCAEITAKRAVIELELLGELDVDREGGSVVINGGRVNDYRVVMDPEEQLALAAEAVARYEEDPPSYCRASVRKRAAERRRELEELAERRRDGDTGTEHLPGINLIPGGSDPHREGDTTPSRDGDTGGGREGDTGPGRDVDTPYRSTKGTRRETKGTTSAPTPDGADAPEIVDLDEPTRGEVVGESGRRRDLLFEALCEACRIDPAELTSSYRGAVNKALKDLREVGAIPEEIHRRARAFRVRWPRVTLTPPSLAKHWATCAPESTVEHMTESTPDGTSARIARIAAEREARREREERAS